MKTCWFFKPILLIFVAAFVVGAPLTLWAAKSRSLLGAKMMSARDVAQNEGEAYDPFTDYSEYDEASDEEADINFFQNGRFFTLGFAIGARTFTETMANLFAPAPAFGLNLTYFFDLRFALQMSFDTGTHTVGFTTPRGTRVNGTMSISNLGMDVKYYFNTQNVTRGLAQMNPYVVGGFSQVTRTATIDQFLEYGRDAQMGFDMGAGIELPMLRNKMYFGAQLLYRLVTFYDENKEMIISDSLGAPESTGLFPRGDLLTLSVVFGVNF